MRYIRLKLVFLFHNATSLKLKSNIRSKVLFHVFYRIFNVATNVILMYYMVFGKCNTNTQGLKIAKKHHELQNQLLIKILPFYKTTLFLSTRDINSNWDNGDAFLTPCLNSSCNCSSHDAQNKDIIYEICSMQSNW